MRHRAALGFLCLAVLTVSLARPAGELGAREPVPPPLELVKSGKPIEHECVE